MARTNKSRVPALAYYRTSSSQPPRIAKLRVACRCRFSLSLSFPTLVAEFYDAAVSGADPIQDRPGFAQLLDRIHATRLTSPHPLKIFLKIEE